MITRYFFFNLISPKSRFENQYIEIIQKYATNTFNISFLLLTLMVSQNLASHINILDLVKEAKKRIQ